MTTMDRLCRTPAIWICDGLLEKDQIQALEREIARQLPGAKAAGDTKHDSTGLSFEMDVSRDATATLLRDRAQELLGLGNALGQTLRYRRYVTGESHPPHCDHFEVGDLALVATALFHLADTGSGGETRFPHALPSPVAVEPKRGRMVLWMNHAPDGSADPLSIHDAAPVEAGEKITLTQFLYQPVSALEA